MIFNIYSYLKKNKEVFWSLSLIFVIFIILYRIVPMTFDGWLSKTVTPDNESFINKFVPSVKTLYFTVNGIGGFLNYIFIALKELYLTNNGRMMSIIVSAILESFPTEIPLDIFNALLIVATYYGLVLICEDKIKSKKNFFYGSILFISLILFISEEMRHEILFYANTTYIAPIPLILFYFYFFKCYLKKEEKKNLVYMSLIGLAIGMWIEHIAAGFLATISIMLLFLFFKKHKSKWKLSLPVLITGLSFLIMMCSPGLRINRNLTATEVSFFTTVFTNFYTLYIDIISNNIFLFLVLYIIILLVFLVKKTKNIKDYFYIGFLIFFIEIFVLTLCYRNFSITYLSFLNFFFPTEFTASNFVIGLIMSVIILSLIIYGIFNIIKAEHKQIYIYLILINFMSLIPILLTPNTGARISSIGFMIFVCITILLLFKLFSLNRKLNKYINLSLLFILFLALDKTILMERRIFDVNQKRESILNSVVKKQELNEWDYSKYVFVPLYKIDDMPQQGAPIQSSLHYILFLQSYGLDQRTNIIFSNHNVSAIQEITIKDYILSIKTNLNNKELIKYKISYGTAYMQKELIYTVENETDWTQDDFEIKVISGFYKIDVAYKRSASSLEITDQYNIYVV